MVLTHATVRGNWARLGRLLEAQLHPTLHPCVHPRQPPGMAQSRPSTSGRALRTPRAKNKSREFNSSTRSLVDCKQQREGE